MKSLLTLKGYNLLENAKATLYKKPSSFEVCIGKRSCILAYALNIFVE